MPFFVNTFICNLENNGSSADSVRPRSWMGRDVLWVIDYDPDTGSVSIKLGATLNFEPLLQRNENLEIFKRCNRVSLNMNVYFKIVISLQSWGYHMLSTQNSGTLINVHSLSSNVRLKIWVKIRSQGSQDQVGQQSIELHSVWICLHFQPAVTDFNLVNYNRNDFYDFSIADIS